MDEYILDEIEDFEESHVDSEKINGKYYIGSYYRDPNYGNLLASSISTRGFYKYSTTDVSEYLFQMSIFENTHKSVDIIKVRILEDGSYLAEVKTGALEAIQRKWKTVYAKWLDKVKSPGFLKGREMGKVKMRSIIFKGA